MNRTQADRARLNLALSVTICAAVWFGFPAICIWLAPFL